MAMRSFGLRSWLRRWKEGAPRPRRIWLTLDDGPEPDLTERILRVLDHHGVKATFFMIGEKVEAHPAVARRVFEAGHRIGNHTFTHPRLTELSAASVRQEIARTDQALASYGGATIFRPPYGACSASIRAIAAELGHETIVWDIDPTDWDPACQPVAWIDNAVSQLREVGDCVILTHDNRETTAEHYDGFIRAIKTTGPISFADPSFLRIPPPLEEESNA